MNLSDYRKFAINPVILISVKHLKPCLLSVITWSVSVIYCIPLVMNLGLFMAKKIKGLSKPFNRMVEQ